MAEGIIKRWNADRGFGFIKPDDGGADVFVHVSAFTRAGLGEPDEGDHVAYEVQTDPRTGKPEAINLRAL